MLKTIKETYFELMAFLRNPKTKRVQDLQLPKNLKSFFHYYCEILLMETFSL
jgi:hypothetical protein